MVRQYVVHPDAIEKLNAAGLTDRIANAPLPPAVKIIRKETLPLIIADLNARGYYKELSLGKNLPTDLQKYGKVLNSLYDNLGHGEWLVSRPDGFRSNKIEFDDVLMYSGYYAAAVLSPNEIWHYKKFGFENASDFIASVSSLVIDRMQPNHDTNHSWVREAMKNGIKTSTFCQVGLLQYAGIVLKQANITPYRTTDPMGNSSNCRPRVSPDSFSFSSRGTSHVDFFNSVLTYADQLKLKPVTLEDSGNKLLSLLPVEIAQDVPQSNLSLRNKVPLPKLDDLSLAPLDNEHSFFSKANNRYSMCVDENNNLILAILGRGRKKIGVSREIIHFLPTEVDDILTGIFADTKKLFSKELIADLASALRARYQTVAK